MIGMGYGSQTSATRSQRPWDAHGVDQLVDDLAHEGTQAGRPPSGVNAGATRRRSRLWSSPSALRIDGRSLPRRTNSGSVIPSSWATRPAAEKNRRSRSTATQSS